MSQGHDTFLTVQHQFGGYFVPATCRTEFNLLNFMGHVAVTKRCKDAMKLRVYGCATCPCNRIKS